MSHNRSLISRIALTIALGTIALAAAPTAAHASTGVVAEATTAKTAPGQPKFGDKGPAVIALQSAIIKNGFTLKGGATGTFDKRTQTVLRTFQRIVGLKVTGVVDAATVSALKLSDSTTTTVAPTTTVATPTTTVAAPTTTVAPVFQFTSTTLPVRGAKGDAVVTVQKALVAAGFQVKGGVDGLFGSGTTTTIQAFQTAKGLAVTGVLDLPTASALGLVAQAAPAAAPAASAAPVVNAGLSVLPVRGNKGASVVTVQKALVAAGITVKGGVDGVFGVATTVAITKFQTSKGIAASGKLDTRTAIALGVTAAPSVQIDVFPIQGVCSFENTWGAPRSGGRQHKGVDIIAKEGNLIYAATDGTITKLYTEGIDKLSGNGFRLTAANGTYFFYGHLKSLAPGIGIGTKVKAGQVLGYNGHTGDTNTPHLHFEVHPFGGEAIDPTAIVDAVNACNITTPRANP